MKKTRATKKTFTAGTPLDAAIRAALADDSDLPSLPAGFAAGISIPRVAARFSDFLRVAAVLAVALTGVALAATVAVVRHRERSMPAAVESSAAGEAMPTPFAATADVPAPMPEEPAASAASVPGADAPTVVETRVADASGGDNSGAAEAGEPSSGTVAAAFVPTPAESGASVAKAVAAPPAAATSAVSAPDTDGEVGVTLNSASYVMVMANSGPLAGTWSLDGITAWNGATQTVFAVASNRVYAAASAATANGDLPAGSYVHQLSVFNQWDGSRTRSYRVQLAQPVGANAIYARVTAVTVSQPGVNLVDCPDPRELKDDLSKIAASYTGAADLAAFPVTKLRFKHQDGYVESAGARDACVNTGYYPGPNTRIEFDFEFTGLDHKAEPFGSYASADLVGGYCFLGSSSTFAENPQISYVLSSATAGNGQSSNAYGAETGHRYCIVVDFNSSSGSFEVWTEGTREYQRTLAAPNAARSYFPMSIIGSNSKKYGGGTANPPKMKVYGCRIYESGELVRNFTPCVRGGIPGFKETCGGVFVTSGNVASLTAGGDIWTDPDDPYVALDYPDHESGNLPAGVRLYFTPNDEIGPDSRIEFDYALLTQPTHTGGAYLFESYGSKRMAVFTSGGHYAFTLNGNVMYNTGDIGDVQYMLATNAYGIRRTIVMDKDSIRFVTAGFTNVVKTVASAQSATNDKFMIGNYSGDLKRSMPMRIYGYSIYTNGVLQKKYVPSVTNGVPGLVDALSGVWTFPYTKNSSAPGGPVAKAGGNIVCADGSNEAYLEFPGTGGGIDTGYRVAPGSRIEADFALWDTYNLSTGVVQHLLYQASGTYVRLDADKNSDGAMKWLYRNYVSPFTYNDTGVSVSNRRMQYILDGRDKTMSLKCGGETLYSAAAEDWATNPGGNPNNLIVGKNNAFMRLYRLAICEYVDGEKTTVRDFVPCVKNDVAGLYDLCGTGFYPLEGGRVSGRGAKGVGEFVDVPSAVRVTKTDSTVPAISVLAVGAQSYEWFADGERIEGESGDSLIVDWKKIRAPYTVPYAVVPVYEVFNETVRGAAATVVVTMPPKGTAIVLQ